MTAPRRIRADNPGPFTLDGSVTWLVGHERVVILDPGPDLGAHVRALAHAVRNAHEVRIVTTHGHPDHVGGLDRLVERLSTDQIAVADIVGAGHRRARPPAGDEPIPFDGGSLRAIDTPGHTRDHLAWYRADDRSLFAGDHILGVGDTTWVAEYPGCVADYLASLERIRRLDLATIHPGHGPDLADPAAAIDRFEAHRRARIEQVRSHLRRRPGSSLDDLYMEVYGDTVPTGLQGAARRALAAVVDFVQTRDAGGTS